MLVDRMLPHHPGDSWPGSDAAYHRFEEKFVTIE
jgi:hypothetical protein